MHPDCAVPTGLETTGRYIVTFREDAQAEALALLDDKAGMGAGKLLCSSDFAASGIEVDQVPGDGGAVLEHLRMAVVNVPPDAAGVLAMEASEASPILAVEPEGVAYAIGQPEGVSLEYLRGFRDATQSLFAAASASGAAAAGAGMETAGYGDSPTHTWGLVATNVPASKYAGVGIRVAVLDTGLFLAHPDFAGRAVVSRAFLEGVTSANDGHGHGTHCTGTACGPLRPGVGPRYGVAHKADIFIGKVLSDQGSGADGGILAGIDWAVANACHVVSMSLSARTCGTTTFYQTAGERALNAGCLVVAAAGNSSDRAHGLFACVERPANSMSFLAVAALDANLAVANFSCRDTVGGPGTAVDIAAPGVAVYSTWPMPARYNTISGTSMATPHVAGIAALWAEAAGVRGAGLWQRLITSAKTLPLPIVDVGRGLVQAP